MKKIILIPDSFKGTMSSHEICETLKSTILTHCPKAEVISIPVADGGEGSVDCFLSAVGGEKISVKVKGPLFDDMRSFYGFIDGGKTAVIEMASCAGLPLVEGRKDPLSTTTYGVGLLIAHAKANGAQRIIVGLGGSCTNDGACGAAAACGVKFLDKGDRAFVPTGGTLKNIAHIDISEAQKNISDIEMIAMCDIDNPMYGPTGAAYIFGPQKGATRDMVVELDDGLKHLSDVIRSDLGLDLSLTPGAGAAGAMGAGMMAFFGAKLQMGIETVLDTTKFDRLARDADMIITGEGKIDGQSLRGKVVIGVARRAKRLDVPVIAIVGGADYDVAPAYDEGVTAIFTINRLPQELSVLRAHSRENLAFVADNIMRTIKAFGVLG